MENHPQEKIQQLQKTLDECAWKIWLVGGIPVSCTIPYIDIETYNLHWMPNGKTNILKQSENYTEMQEDTPKTIDEINMYILQKNKDYHLSTPHCPSVIPKRHHKGKNDYYSISWDRLHDGVHGTHTTRTLWAHSISAAIMKYRSSTLMMRNPPKSHGGGKKFWNESPYTLILFQMISSLKWLLHFTGLHEHI